MIRLLLIYPPVRDIRVCDHRRSRYSRQAIYRDTPV